MLGGGGGIGGAGDVVGGKGLHYEPYTHMRDRSDTRDTLYTTYPSYTRGTHDSTQVSVATHYKVLPTLSPLSINSDQIGSKSEEHSADTTTTTTTIYSLYRLLLDSPQTSRTLALNISVDYYIGLQFEEERNFNFSDTDLDDDL